MPYSAEFDRSGFNSGEPELDLWLKEFASQGQRKNITRTFVAVRKKDNRVIGYYASLVTSIAPSDSSAMTGLSNGKYPASALLIARLAVDQEFQGRAVGSALLAHALRGAAAVSMNAGVLAVVVDAIDSEVATYYQRQGFISFVDNPLRLFLPMKTILASLREAD